MARLWAPLVPYTKEEQREALAQLEPPRRLIQASAFKELSLQMPFLYATVYHNFLFKKLIDFRLYKKFRMQTKNSQKMNTTEMFNSKFVSLFYHFL